MNDALPAALVEIAAVARRQTSRVAASVYHDRGDPVNRSEFRAYSESAAWLAYAELGGTPETADSFDWVANRNTLLRRTQRELRRILKGADQSYTDGRLRSRSRPDRARVQEFRWSAWGEPASEAAHQHGHAQRPAVSIDASTASTSSNCDREIQEHELEEQLVTLGHLLNEYLEPDELLLLKQHYFEGQTQQSIATALAQTEARYAGVPDAEAKAYNSVLVRTCRLRQKLRKKLGPQWLMVKRELEEGAA